MRVHIGSDHAGWEAKQMLVAALAVLHWDFWFWSDRTLLFGFLPIGLAYHAAFSLAAMTVWALAVRYAWPADLEEWANASPDDGPGAAA